MGTNERSRLDLGAGLREYLWQMLIRICKPGTAGTLTDPVLGRNSLSQYRVTVDLILEHTGLMEYKESELQQSPCISWLGTCVSILVCGEVL